MFPHTYRNVFPKRPEFVAQRVDTDVQASQHTQPLNHEDDMSAVRQSLPSHEPQ